MRKTAIVKIRKSKGNCFVSIPKNVADGLKAEYLRVALLDGRLVYTPVPEEAA